MTLVVGAKSLSLIRLHSALPSCCHSFPQIQLHCLVLCVLYFSLSPNPCPQFQSQRPLLSLSLPLLRRRYISHKKSKTKARGEEKESNLSLPSSLLSLFFNMRKHGWQLPYHPLQVVAIAVFLALGFAFYVFFVPFVGKRILQYIVIGLYTPLVTAVIFLYIWCAAADPGDPGIFKSKKYLKAKHMLSLHGDEKELQGSATKLQIDGENKSCLCRVLSVPLLVFYPLNLLCNWCNGSEDFSEQMSEDGTFFCSLCEVEVLKYSKHCRVCDKCVDGFDHHCRWLNNCIGRRNYKRFFTLMVSALLLLILQWSVGLLVLILCFLNRHKFSVEIVSKLGSSFSLVPFVIVVVSCTLLAMVATLPLAQLFFFHILLIKKGISTYDYIIALREQEQQEAGGGQQQSPQMSPVSSFTGLSSASSFGAFHRGSWCTPPRLFLEDQFDVIPPDAGTSVSSAGKRMKEEEPTKRKPNPHVKISPWALARLNAEEVSKAAAEARKKSRVLQPVTRRHPSAEQQAKRSSKRGYPSSNRFPSLEPLAKISSSVSNSDATSQMATSLAPLQLEARSAFQPSRKMGLGSSPESSLDSPDLHPFRISSSGGEEMGMPVGSGPGNLPAHKGIHLSRSTSDGYDASGGEDSDRIPSRIVHRSANWAVVTDAKQGPFSGGGPLGS
ncbi:S-acyltransferase [Rhynchospora pubera]|uniref:S-acyltransferase n=1 Tax=Rhynchospora pubera TaxID=906938 RepID=A0AAV8DHI2_9POAL|nr:S-acyltransferase [Rhynchospora pubera]